MYEKLVENWLTSVNELGYQLPFCEALIAEGYTILHISRHGRGEHGKDVIARRSDGVLCTFQLKGGDINLSAWREIRGEVEELVRLPLRFPGISETEPHIPHLVTNGELRGDAVESIRQFSDAWERQGSPKLQVWQRGTVLDLFLSAQGSYLPTRLSAFRDFVNLYVGPFSGQLSRAELARLLERISDGVPTDLTNRQLARAIAALVVVSGYIVEQYAQAGNHCAAMEGWVITAAAILHLAERQSSSVSVYEATLNLVRLGFERSLGLLFAEARDRDNFVELGGLADAMVYGVRATRVIGWAAYLALEQLRTKQLDGSKDLIAILKREGMALQWLGEADWPLRVALVLWLDRIGRCNDAEAMLIGWAQSLLPHRDEEADTPSPYWPPEKVLRRRYGLLARLDNERFGNHTYTLSQCLDMLVRRLRRQAVAQLWPACSHMTMCNFEIDPPDDFYRWRTDNGVLRERLPELTASWSEWRNRVFKPDTASVPVGFRRHPEWALAFVIVYPHRANQQMTTYLDGIYTSRIAVDDTVESRRE